MILSTEYPPAPGGIGTHARALACGLVALGWDVQVLATQLGDDPAEVEAFNRSEAYAIEALPRRGGRLGRAVGAHRAVRRVERTFRPDLVLATGGRACWLAAGAVRTPWVAVGHGTEFGAPHAIARRMNRWAYGRARVVVAVSAYTRRLIEAAGIRARSLAVIHNGADDERFEPAGPQDRAAARARWGLGDGPVLLTVGSVTERKGQHVVIEALPSLVARWPKLVYVAAGIAYERARCAALADRLGVTDRVRFLGPITAGDLESIYHASDLFCMTSTRTTSGDVEGFGIAIIEAALCGVPAVVSDSGGLPEAVEHGVTGLCVAEGDGDAVAHAIATLCSDEDGRRAMGAAARARALESYTWTRVTRAFAELLEAARAG